MYSTRQIKDAMSSMHHGLRWVLLRVVFSVGERFVRWTEASLVKHGDLRTVVSGSLPSPMIRLPPVMRPEDLEEERRTAESHAARAATHILRLRSSRYTRGRDVIPAAKAR